MAYAAALPHFLEPLLKDYLDAALSALAAQVRPPPPPPPPHANTEPDMYTYVLILPPSPVKSSSDLALCSWLADDVDVAGREREQPRPAQ
jgi:hypothetical protein